MLILILLVLLVGWWSISFFADEPHRSAVVSAPDTSLFVDSAYAPTAPLLIHHAVVNDTHIYRGSLAIPVDCDALSTSIAVSGRNPTHVQVSLMVWRSYHNCSTTNNLATTPFSVSFSNNVAAPVVFDGITVNNKKVFTSLVDGK